MREGRTSLTEETRRAQLVEVTIDLVAEHGYAGTSLQRIADAAGITKPAVLYYFASKSAVVAAAQQAVLSALVERVSAAVDAADPAGAPAAYVREMVAHFREHPRHARMMVEALVHTGTPAEDSSARWGPLAALLQAATGQPGDHRALALVVGGGIDAIVAEQMRDPGFDSAAAAEVLVGLLPAAGGPPVSGARG
ncbi:TetR family transcriptional regulator [Auraticoccus sp. F435]|uniref:TetR family transcriptional regulator n=1 Tax=Auraticoccus cholistanensis TaxID=2656650 RepID=A0A6A9V0U0_9ACTN|nr:TetR/AcrR family transcriptional regulator [Auraticoccus cholistanensis]MVA76229.1 TetR family transcriptional regulator [Auraticoccus cholistanensis]